LSATPRLWRRRMQQESKSRDNWCWRGAFEDEDVTA